MSEFELRFREPAEWLDEQMSAVDFLAQLRKNWDSYGAEPVSKAAIVAAKNLLRLLSRIDGVSRPHVAASPSGYPALIWEFGGISKELTVEVRDTGVSISYFDSTDDNLSFDWDSDDE